MPVIVLMKPQNLALSSATPKNTIIAKTHVGFYSNFNSAEDFHVILNATEHTRRSYNGVTQVLCTRSLANVP